ncbi:hypothetical protein GXM_05578 [Nostoc sphaeroides CCNUC1]|uniref:Uncharacterized protein n=1 Tax=Nostoc sphaeroides CCNUC1 TaxID=2653204 RepID=A0A5P8W772_9NOSO|nr:hypothetical protein GXM_05578 [Nostoc sphaeroides CCNUC1]
MVFWLLWLGWGRWPFKDAASCWSDILGGEEGVSYETVLNNTIFNRFIVEQ